MNPLVLILAGGEGKRFKPFVTDKTLFPYFGKPLIQHTIEMLQKAGLQDILISTNAQNDKWVKNNTFSHINVRTKILPKPLGMGEAVLNVEHEIGSRPLLVINANDLVNDLLLPSLLKQAANTYALVTGLYQENYFPGGYLKVEGNKVLSIVEKPEKGTEPSKLVKLVFDYFSKPEDFITELKTVKTANDDHYEQALGALMKKHQIGFLEYKGPWATVKRNFHVLNIAQFLLQNSLVSKISPLAQISPHSVIIGDVVIEEGAKVYEYAVIKGPAYIGKNAIIGNHALVMNSIIEEKAIIGMGSEVTRSYIGPNCALHHNFIGDSVLEADINPSYGSCTANWRLDKKSISAKLGNEKVDTGREKFGALVAKGAFFGINTLLLPGSVIGANAKTYPGTIVHNYLPPGATLKHKQEQEIIQG